MRNLVLMTAIIVSLSSFVDAQPLVAVPTKAKVVFPGPPPQPAAPVLPDAVTTLQSNQLYVVTSDEPFVLIASPARLVRITQEDGPIKIRAVFADGSGSLETRQYAAKFIATVEATASTGRVELVSIPLGLMDESDLTRRLIDIGAAPRPPPGPDPDDVVPDPPIPTPTGFRVLFIFRTADKIPMEQRNILYSSQITAFLTEHCVKGADGRPEWRKWEPDVVIGAKESPTMVELWKSAKPKLGEPPKMIVAVNGAATVYDLPSTESEALAKLKKLAGVP